MRRIALPLSVVLVSLLFLAPQCPTGDEKVRIIAYGDSLTYGWWILSSYPMVLEEMMELPNGTILNAGLSGEMLAYSEPRLSEILDCGEYPLARFFYSGREATIFWSI